MSQPAYSDLPDRRNRCFGFAARTASTTPSGLRYDRVPRARLSVSATPQEAVAEGASAFRCCLFSDGCLYTHGGPGCRGPFGADLSAGVTHQSHFRRKVLTPALTSGTGDEQASFWAPLRNGNTHSPQVPGTSPLAHGRRVGTSGTSPAGVTPSSNNGTSSAAIVATRAEWASRGARSASRMTVSVHLQNEAKMTAETAAQFACSADHYCCSLLVSRPGPFDRGVIFAREE